MENTKIYARQVNPEYQDSCIFDDEYYNDIIIKGNKDFLDRNTDLLNDIDDVEEDIYNIAEFENISDFATEADYAKIAAELSSCYTTEYHSAWTVDEVKRFITLADKRANSMSGYKRGEEPEIYTAEMLSIYTGIKWEWTIISGCCQSEWQIIYYPVGKYSDKNIDIFETGYFNTGTEWIIHDDDYIPESPEDISGYRVYCYTFDPRKELAEFLGVPLEDIVMYRIEMCYTPVYSEMA